MHNKSNFRKVKSEDSYLLQQILDEMESSHRIYSNNDGSSHITISSKTIYNDIINLGGMEKKSMILKFPSIPYEFMDDFLRGYFDGDGCATYKKDRKYWSRYICSGSMEFIQYAYSWLKENGIIRGSGVYNSQGTKIPRLLFNKQDGESFESFMMRKNPSMFLKRKHNLT